MRYYSIIILLFQFSFLVHTKLCHSQTDSSAFSGIHIPIREKEPSMKIQAPVMSEVETSLLVNIDVLHYDIELDIHPDTQSLIGHASILAKIDTAIAKNVQLNLVTLEVDSVYVGTEKVAFSRYPDLLLIELTKLENPDSVQIHVWYHGQPQNDGFGGFFFAQGIIYTVGEGINTYPPSMTRYWIPCNDTPSDKATLDMRIKVPTTMQAISNGTLISSTFDPATEKNIYHWREIYPIATYLIAVAISNYASFGENYISITGDTIPLEFYVYPQDFQKAHTDFANVSKMMSFFEQVFGPYPFERYAMVEAPMRGAMEHQTMTSYSASLISGDNRNDAIVAHELAHQWYGDLVTLTDWREIWLNEGFASYCEALFFEWLYGSEVLPEYMQHFEDSYFLEDGQLGSFAIYDPKYLWGATVYDKGAWVLHMLRWTIGDSAFWHTMRHYVQKFAYSNATISDFKEVAESESGQDLDWFFEQWIYDAGYPKYALSWDYEETSHANFAVNLSIEQIQTSEQIFSMPVEIQVLSQTSLLSDTIWIYDISEHVEFLTSNMPIDLKFDPNNWILKKANIISSPLPPGFVAGQYDLAQNYPNPFHPDKIQETTLITFQIGNSDIPSNTRLCVYDIRGRLVTTLIDEKMTPGVKKVLWDGLDNNGKPVPSGAYIYRLETATNTISKQLYLIR